MGDRGCGHFISFNVCRSGTIALAVIKSPDNSASEAEDMTTLIIWARDRTGPLSREISSLYEKKMCNPARLRARVFFGILHWSVKLIPCFWIYK